MTQSLTVPLKERNLTVSEPAVINLSIDNDLACKDPLDRPKGIRLERVST